MAVADTVPAPELSATGFRLRPWRIHDAGGLHEAVKESWPTVGRWLAWCHARYSHEEAQAWITHCRQGWSRGEHFAFAIVDDRSGDILGGAGLGRRDRTGDSANLGYWVRQSRQGEGMAARAASLVASFGFEQLRLARIEIVVLPENHASRRTAEKIGARFETMARRRPGADERTMNMAVYGLVRGEVVRANPALR